MSSITNPVNGGALPAADHKSRRAALALFGRAAAIAAVPVSALAAGLAAAPAAPDPIFAVIEDHRRYRIYWNSLARDEDAFNAAAEADEAKCQALGETEPTTAAGAVALIEYLLEVERDFLDPRSPLSAGLRHGVDALKRSGLVLVASTVPGAPTPAKPVDDPIFAAIERHKAAFEAMADAGGAIPAGYRGGPLEDALDAAYEAQEEAGMALRATTPRTAAGMRAAIEWFVEYDRGCIPESSGYFLPTLLKSPVLNGAIELGRA